MTENQQKFIDGLNKLTQETGLTIGSCGCCFSPWLYPIEDEQEPDGEYGFREHNDDIELIQWSQKEEKVR